MQEQQTPEQALKFLDNVASTVAGSRLDHVNIQRAVDTIRQALPQPEKEAEAEAEDTTE